jgi:hypothetical protein
MSGTTFLNEWTALVKKNLKKEMTWKNFDYGHHIGVRLWLEQVLTQFLCSVFLFCLFAFPILFINLSFDYNIINGSERYDVLSACFGASGIPW